MMSARPVSETLLALVPQAGLCWLQRQKKSWSDELSAHYQVLSEGTSLRLMMFWVCCLPPVLWILHALAHVRWLYCSSSALHVASAILSIWGSYLPERPFLIAHLLYRPRHPSILLYSAFLIELSLSEISVSGWWLSLNPAPQGRM